MQGDNDWQVWNGASTVWWGRGHSMLQWQMRVRCVAMAKRGRGCCCNDRWEWEVLQWQKGGGDVMGQDVVGAGVGAIQCCNDRWGLRHCNGKKRAGMLLQWQVRMRNMLQGTRGVARWVATNAAYIQELCNGTLQAILAKHFTMDGATPTNSSYHKWCNKATQCCELSWIYCKWKELTFGIKCLFEFPWCHQVVIQFPVQILVNLLCMWLSLNCICINNWLQEFS